MAQNGTLLADDDWQVEDLPRKCLSALGMLPYADGLAPKLPATDFDASKLAQYCRTSYDCIDHDGNVHPVVKCVIDLA